MPPKKKGSARKARKRNMRKIDVTDIEAAVQEASKAEALKAVASAALFTVDRGGSDVREKNPRIRKRKLAQMTPSATELIGASTSAVPLPYKRENEARKKVGDTKRVNEMVEKRAKRAKLSHNESLEDATATAVVVADGAAAGGSEAAVVAAAWGVQSSEGGAGKGSKAALSKRLFQDSALDALSSGMSYRPSHESHQETLAEAVGDEMRRLEAAANVERHFEVSKEVKKLPRKMQVTREFFESDEDEASSEGDADPQNGVAVPASEPQKRKTRRDKNKAMRRKEEQKKERNKKTKQRIGKDIDMIPGMIESIVQTEQLREVAKKRKAEVAVTQVKKKVGKFKVEAPLPAVTLTDELPSSLRNVKGPSFYNPIQDQYASMHQRGVVEPRKKVERRRRHQKKSYQTREWREFMQSK